MEGIARRTIEQIEAYQGPHEIPGVRFRHARRELGVTAFGINVIEIDPHCSGYPEHDHVADGQEEVYVVLDGAAELVVDGEPLGSVERGTLVRVAPNRRRQFVTGESGITLLAIGNTPGQAYEVKAF